MKQRGTRAKAGRGAPERSGRTEVRVRMTVACTRKNCKNGPILLAARSVTLVARRRKSCSQIGTQILNVGLTSHLCCQNPSVSADHERACRASLSKSERLWLVEGEIGFGQWRACACQNPTQQRTGHLRRSNLQLGESGQGLRLAARAQHGAAKRLARRSRKLATGFEKLAILSQVSSCLDPPVPFRPTLDLRRYQYLCAYRLAAIASELNARPASLRPTLIQHEPTRDLLIADTPAPHSRPRICH